MTKGMTVTAEPSAISRLKSIVNQLELLTVAEYGNPGKHAREASGRTISRIGSLEVNASRYNPENVSDEERHLARELKAEMIERTKAQAHIKLANRLEEIASMIESIRGSLQSLVGPAIIEAGVHARAIMAEAEDLRHHGP